MGRRSYGLVFTGPLVLVPLWRLHGWFLNRWVTHDCKRQPITCRLEWFCGIDPFERWVEDEEGAP